MTDEEVNVIDKSELFAATVALREDGIFQIDMKMINQELSLKDVRELTEAVGIVGKGAQYPVLILVKEFNTISKEASEYSASEIGGRYTLANAVVIKSAAIRIGVNFFINMFKPERPTKMFNNEDKAIAWLRSQIIS